MGAAVNGARKAMLAKVHIAAKEMALAPESYRAIFERITEHSSASDCTDAQLDAVLAEFRRLGWKPKSKAPRSDVPQARKIFALWTAMKPLLRDGSRAALCAFVKRQTGIDRPEWLDGAQANKVIEALKAWRQRLEQEMADAEVDG